MRRSPHRPPRPFRRGFTLLEILLTLALIGLLSAFLVGGSARLLSTRGNTPAEVFWKAVAEARRTALQSGREVRLRFDGETRAFLLLDSEAPPPGPLGEPPAPERPLRRFSVSPELAGDLEVDFLGAAAQGANAILVGGVLLEARSLPHATFFPDGTCAPFRAQLARAGGRSVLRIDPWTCAPVLTPDDDRTAP
jgi:general secretion pathway protein H